MYLLTFENSVIKMALQAQAVESTYSSYICIYMYTHMYYIHVLTFQNSVIKMARQLQS